MDTSGFIDIITVKSQEVKDAIEAVTFIAVILMVVITAVKTKLSLAAILMSAIVGGIVLWLVNGGINTTADLAKDEFSQRAPHEVSAPL